MSWRVGVRLKNSATGVDFYLLFVVGSSLILVGSCPDVVVPCFSLGCVPQLVYFFPWIQTDWVSICDGCVSLKISAYVSVPRLGVCTCCVACLFLGATSSFICFSSFNRASLGPIMVFISSLSCNLSLSVKSSIFSSDSRVSAIRVLCYVLCYSPLVRHIYIYIYIYFYFFFCFEAGGHSRVQC